ncbi:MAG: DNA recombination protein RmuC [Alistipes sp.]
MDTMVVFGILVAGLFLGAVCGYLVARIRTVAAETGLAGKNKECETVAAERDAVRAESAALRSELTSVKTENARLSEQLRQEGEERAKIRRDSELAFREIASSILDEKTKVFKESNEARLAEILNPFKENIETLRKTINDCYTGEVSEVKSLKESLRMLTDLNATIGREAKELTVALRGNSKVQGDWGEMVLRKILEKTGLEEGVNYDLQATTNTDGSKITGSEGNSLRPDAVFHLPEGKNIVIDSKVSLTAYTDYVNASDEQTRQISMKEHLASVRRHVDELAAKRYDKYVNDAADFVMMFMPNESAYVATMQGDEKMWDYAYGKRIVLVGPTHLMSVIQLMNQLWTQDKQNKNALKIAEETGKLYDKFVGFVGDLKEVGAALDKASKRYDAAYSKLSVGNGNLLTKIDNIRKLGVKTTKRLPVAEQDE